MKNLKSSWSSLPISKKILFIGLSIFVLAICGFYVSAKESKTPDVAVVVSITPVPSSSSPSTEVVPTGEKVAPYKWNLYGGATYSFQYPPDWVVQSYPVSGGGQIITVKPSALEPGLNYPQFILQTQPASPNALEMKSGFLLGLGFKESDAKLNDLSVKKLSGTIPFKTVGSKTVMEPLQDTTYIVSKGDTLYLLKYEYEGATSSDMLEDFFTGFTESFKVTK